jgi:hypothetical protein
MPPASYLLIALIMVVVVAAGLAATQGYGIFLFYVLFAAAACLLALIGVFRISHGLEAPFWIGLALAAPAFVWGLHRVFELIVSGSPFLTMSIGFRTVAALAATAAAAACVRLIELVSVSNAATRIVYGILALGALLTLVGIVQYAMGGSGTLTRNVVFSASAKWVRWPVVIVEYGALAVAPILVVVRRRVEGWVLVPIVGLAVVEGYAAAFPYHGFPRGPLATFQGLWFWLKPVVYFVASAAIWRMGSVLLSQRREQKALSGVAA